MEIYQATEEEYPQIRKIWDLRFPAFEEYQQIVFSEIIPNCKNMAARVDGKIISILSLLPMNYIDGISNITLSGWYMFGVATLSEYEGRGIASSLIKQTLINEKAGGFDFVFEKPADQTLNNFYRKLGFSIGVRRPKYMFPVEHTDNILEIIRTKFPKRFEWKDPNILKSLIKLGEIETHNQLQSLCEQEEIFIAINPLKEINPKIFEETFFCFPME